MIKTEQKQWTQDGSWAFKTDTGLGETAQLVFVFGATALLRNQELLTDIRSAYPSAHLLGCSTAGEILGTEVFDDTLALTAVEFEHTKIKSANVELNSDNDSLLAGKQLAQELVGDDDLTHVFVLSDGIHVNGSHLVRGLEDNLPEGVLVTGGLAGDGSRFEKTRVIIDDQSTQRRIGAIGFYGNRLKIGCSSWGGWDPFGPERIITRSENNVLYELDGQSALDLYKKYLGDYAADLPASGLLFPLSLRSQSGKRGLVRTILGVDEETNSMTFAGDVPEGYVARFMKANVERLIDGAIEAAQNAHDVIQTEPQLAVLISCVGRKLVMQQRTEEEVEGVLDVLGPNSTLTGFYSYGEIAPFIPTGLCELHNQTMTITTFNED
jgi:hypothetical protein